MSWLPGFELREVWTVKTRRRPMGRGAPEGWRREGCFGSAFAAEEHARALARFVSSTHDLLVYDPEGRDYIWIGMGHVTGPERVAS